MEKGRGTKAVGVRPFQRVIMHKGQVLELSLRPPWLYEHISYNNLVTLSCLALIPALTRLSWYDMKCHYDIMIVPIKST